MPSLPNLPKLPAFVKITEIITGRMTGTIRLLPSNRNPAINLNEIYFNFKREALQFNTPSLFGTVYNLKTHELMFDGEETSIILGLITEWEYVDPINLTNVNMEQLDDDSLIPEDQYKIVA